MFTVLSEKLFGLWKWSDYIHPQAVSGDLWVMFCWPFFMRLSTHLALDFGVSAQFGCYLAYFPIWRANLAFDNLASRHNFDAINNLAVCPNLHTVWHTATIQLGGGGTFGLSTQLEPIWPINQFAMPFASNLIQSPNLESQFCL